MIERLANRRGHEFSLERAAFLTMLHRLVCGGSDRAADRWREDYRIDGVEKIELHHLYRAHGASTDPRLSTGYGRGSARSFRGSAGRRDAVCAA